MAASVIQVEYDRLAEVANGFGRNGETAAALQGQVQRSAQQLRQGGWEGRGSVAFHAEMDTVVFPTLQRLSAALNEAQRVTQQISAVMRRAEEEAAQPFRGHRSQLGTPGSADGVVPPVAAGGLPGQDSPGSSQTAPGLLRPFIRHYRQ